jgi:hypothetical protein
MHPMYRRTASFRRGRGAGRLGGAAKGTSSARDIRTVPWPRIRPKRHTVKSHSLSLSLSRARPRREEAKHVCVCVSVCVCACVRVCTAECTYTWRCMSALAIDDESDFELVISLFSSPRLRRVISRSAYSSAHLLISDQVFSLSSREMRADSVVPVLAFVWNPYTPLPFESIESHMEQFPGLRRALSKLSGSSVLSAFIVV